VLPVIAGQPDGRDKSQLLGQGLNDLVRSIDRAIMHDNDLGAAISMARWGRSLTGVGNQLLDDRPQASLALIHRNDDRNGMYHSTSAGSGRALWRKHPGC